MLLLMDCQNCQSCRHVRDLDELGGSQLPLLPPESATGHCAVTPVTADVTLTASVRPESCIPLPASRL